MKTSLFFAATLCISVSAFGQDRQDLSGNNGNEPPMFGIQWARGKDPLARTDLGTRFVNMSYHGGKIMPTSNTTAIFWGPSWPTDTSDKIPGIASFYSGFSNSNYAKTTDEYTGSNGQVAAASLYVNHLIDPTTAANGSSTSAILAEVCKVITGPDT